VEQANLSDLFQENAEDLTARLSALGLAEQPALGLECLFVSGHSTCERGKLAPSMKFFH